MLTRRQLLGQSATLLAFQGIARLAAQSPAAATVGYGALQKDPERILDLPAGFSYRILSRSGQAMRSDALIRPGKPDGMACWRLPSGQVRLVINHELHREMNERLYPRAFKKWPEQLDPALCYTPIDEAQPGGTSTLGWNPETGLVEDEFLSLTGTDRNCAGGATPWGTWITCEEPMPEPQPGESQHGWCFEVPFDGQGLTKPEPLRGLGRFRHEAIAVNPRTGAIYLTEDLNPGLFYRWLPDHYQPGQRPDLQGGRLQALVIEGFEGSRDTRNQPGGEQAPFPPNQPVAVRWMDLEDRAAYEQLLRERGAAAGATVFSRAEGIHLDPASGDLYFLCTDGGPDLAGQIFRLRPNAEVDGPDQLELFLQSVEGGLLRNGDNVTVMPWGDLMVCEDNSATAHLVGITPGGDLYHLARDPFYGDEFAGVCFDEPSGTLFVNLQGRGLTLAIQGPWPGNRSQA